MCRGHRLLVSQAIVKGRGPRLRIATGVRLGSAATQSGQLRVAVVAAAAGQHAGPRHSWPGVPHLAMTGPDTRPLCRAGWMPGPQIPAEGWNRLGSPVRLIWD
jgi:hypothetical protein